MTPDKREEILELERRIEELRARLPKHSPPVSMLMELDELDDALEKARAGLAEADNS